LEALENIQQGSDEYATKATGFINSMEKFSTYFGIKVSYLVFSAIEQLSITLQGKDTTIQEAVMAANLAAQFIRRQRNDSAFDSFYSSVVSASRNITGEPVLPRTRRQPRRIDGTAAPHSFDTPKDYYRKQYFEVMDGILTEINARFQQKRGMPIAATLEKLVLCAIQSDMPSQHLPDELKRTWTFYNYQHNYICCQIFCLPIMTKILKQSLKR